MGNRTKCPAAAEPSLARRNVHSPRCNSQPARACLPLCSLLPAALQQLLKRRLQQRQQAAGRLLPPPPLLHCGPIAALSLRSRLVSCHFKRQLIQLVCCGMRHPAQSEGRGSPVGARALACTAGQLSSQQRLASGSRAACNCSSATQQQGHSTALHKAHMCTTKQRTLRPDPHLAVPLT